MSNCQHLPTPASLVDKRQLTNSQLAIGTASFVFISVQGPLLCSSRNPASDSLLIFIHLFIFLLSLFLKARLPPYSALSDFKISSPTDSLEHLQNVLPMSSDTLSYCALAVISSSNIGFPVSLLNSTTLPRASCCRCHRLLLSQAFELRH